MRDYAGLIAGLRNGSLHEPDHAELADALEELLTLASKMTTLGVDLEEQIREQLSIDFYALSGDSAGLRYLFSNVVEELRITGVPEMTPIPVDAMRVVGESFFVFFPGDPEALEFFSEDAALQAIAEYRRERRSDASP